MEIASDIPTAHAPDATRVHRFPSYSDYWFCHA